MAYTSADVLESIKRRGMLPDSDQTLSDSDLLKLYNEEVQSFVVPFLRSLGEEFFITPEAIPVLAGVKEYRLPRRSVDIRDITFVAGTSEYSLIRFEPDEAVRRYSPGSTGAPEGFYLQGNYVVLTPTPSEDGTLNVPYLLTPSDLVSSFSPASTAISALTGSTITVASVTGYAVGQYVDVLDPTDLDPIAANLKITGIAGATLTVLPAIPSRVAVGQLLVPENQTTVPHIPRHIRALAEQRVVVKALEAVGDTEGMTNAMNSLGKMVQAASLTLNPRVLGAPRKVRGGMARYAGTNRID